MPIIWSGLHLDTRLNNTMKIRKKQEMGSTGKLGGYVLCMTGLCLDFVHLNIGSQKRTRMSKVYFACAGIFNPDSNEQHASWRITT